MSQIIMSGDMGPQKGQRQAQKAAPAQAGAFKAAAAAVAAKLELAWNKADAAAFAEAFADQADFVPMAGGHVTGRAKIEEAHKALFSRSSGKSRGEYRILKMKPLSPEIVIAFMSQQITSTEDGKTQTMRTRPTAVLRRIGQDWKIVAMQVTRVARVDGSGTAKPAEAKAGAGKAAAAPKAGAKAAKAK